jgi:hypothetical protein
MTSWAIAVPTKSLVPGLTHEMETNMKPTREWSFLAATVYCSLLMSAAVPCRAQDADMQGFDPNAELIQDFSLTPFYEVTVDQYAGKEIIPPRLSIRSIKPAGRPTSRKDA